MLPRPQSLPPQFLLPSWSSGQLGHAIQRAHLSIRPIRGPNWGKVDNRPKRLQKDGSQTLWQHPKASGETTKDTGGSKTTTEDPVGGINVTQDEHTVDLSRSGRKIQHHPPHPHPAAKKPRIRLSGKRAPKLGYHRLSGNQQFELDALQKNLSTVDGAERQESKESSSPRPSASRSEALKPFSLFEELFPDEEKNRRKKEEEALEKLVKLPAFPWSSRNGPDASLEEPAEEDVTYDPEIIRHELPTETPKENRYSTLTQPMPSVLSLNACRSSLEESDFFRTSSRGQHIEGWTRGILKVIPNRDQHTLAWKGNFFILFASEAAARAYLDQTIRLHTLSRMRGTDSESVLPPPPGYLKEGEDLKKVLRGFSIVPGYNKLSLRMINSDNESSTHQLLRYGGPLASIRQKAKSDHLVLFHLDDGYASSYDLVSLLTDDGKRRNLHWKLAGGYNSIFKLEDRADTTTSRLEGGKSKRGWSKPPRYVIPFKDQQEARRFVRDWHRREFPLTKGSQKAWDDSNDSSPIVNAELLW